MRCILLLIILAILSASSSSWPDTVPVLHLEFDETQWEYACEDFWNDIYVPAQLTYEDYTFQCQFRIRGATSRQYPKKSIKIEPVEGFYLFGQDELNLNAEYLDWTRMRECLSFLYYSRTGQIVPEVHLVEVVFNGESQGVYLSVEDVDSDFLLNTPLPDVAVIYKCADRYTTLDRVHDLEPYLKKTHEYQPWDDFLLLLYWLKLCPEDMFHQQLQERFHYDDLVSCVATNVLIGHGSTYYHNYHLVLDETGGTGGWRYITWDMDRTWWKYGADSPYSKNSSNDGNRRNTLIWRMWCNSAIREDLFNEIHRQYPLFLEFSQGNTIDSLAVLIAPLVEIDPFRDYTMDQFWAQTGDLNNWPEARYAGVLEQINHQPLPFSVRIIDTEFSNGDIMVSWQNAGTFCTWRLEISHDSVFNNPADVVYGVFPSDTFHTVPGEFTGSNLWMQVYATGNGVEHRSDNGPIVPAGEACYATSGELVINEINYMSAPQFNPGDWFEIVNTDDETVSLAGWSVRDDNRTNLTTLGELTVGPGECLVFSSDSFSFISAFEIFSPPSQWLTFNLSDNGDRLTLFDLTGNAVDSVAYLPEDPWPWQAAGHGSTLTLLDTSLPNQNPSSWAAGPFGGTPFLPEAWDADWPERGAVSFSVIGPVPVNENLSVKLHAITQITAELYIYDIFGRTVLSPAKIELETGESTVNIAVGDLPSGVYFLAVRNMGFLQTAKITVLSSR